MHKVTIKTILLIAGFSACGIATAGRGQITTPQSPMIMKTVVDSKEKVLIISGRNFGVAPPSVLLAGHKLDVKRSSEREIVASLPPGLTSGNYGVSVITSGRVRVSSNLFSTSLKTAMETMPGHKADKADTTFSLSQNNRFAK